MTPTPSVQTVTADIDPAELWERYLAQASDRRSPQSAMAFACDHYQSSLAAASARIGELEKALEAVAEFMREDVQSGDSDLWTPEYEELHDLVIVALHRPTALSQTEEGR